MALDLKKDLQEVPDALKKHLGAHWKAYSLIIGVAGLGVSWLIYQQGKNPSTTASSSPLDLLPDLSSGGAGGGAGTVEPSAPITDTVEPVTSDTTGDGGTTGGGGVFQKANLPPIVNKVTGIFQMANLPAGSSGSGSKGTLQMASGIAVPNPITGGQPSIFPISNPIQAGDSFGSSQKANLQAAPGAAPNVRVSTGYVAGLLHPRQLTKIPRTLAEAV